MSDKLTPWFHGGVRPDRAGVYERDYGGIKNFGYSKFDGQQWFFRAPSVDAAWAEISGSSLISSTIKWRGLASDPKGSDK